MKFTTLAFVLISTATAYVERTVNENGVVISARWIERDEAASLGKRTCTHNNCLRTYTTATSTAAHPFTSCANAAQASAACACFAPDVGLGLSSFGTRAPRLPELPGM
jgi:hypothetical protein